MMADNWTVESKSGNRLPSDILSVFCKVTTSTELIEANNYSIGSFSLPSPDALVAEIQKFAKQECRARAEKRKREVFL